MEKYLIEKTLNDKILFKNYLLKDLLYIEGLYKIVIKYLSSHTLKKILFYNNYYNHIIRENKAWVIALFELFWIDSYPKRFWSDRYDKLEIFKHTSLKHKSIIQLYKKIGHQTIIKCVYCDDFDFRTPSMPEQVIYGKYKYFTFYCYKYEDNVLIKHLTSNKHFKNYYKKSKIYK